MIEQCFSQAEAPCAPQPCLVGTALRCGPLLPLMQPNPKAAGTPSIEEVPTANGSSPRRWHVGRSVAGCSAGSGRISLLLTFSVARSGLPSERGLGSLIDMKWRRRHDSTSPGFRGFFLFGIFGTLVFVTAALGSTGAETKPFSLHPENPHYFLFEGEPTLLITSAEHYGAVLNRAFDYQEYLKTLEKHGFNNTRVFSGAYVEPQGAFDIAKNTLAPEPNQFLAPWARSETPGYPNGGNKFDLKQWDPDYFERLRDFVREASERGVVVEVCLFCPFYEQKQWRLSPLNAKNNVNGVGAVDRTDVYTLEKSGKLLAIQEAMTKKIVRELNGFDNLYYEVCNEPYFGGVTKEWQYHIAELIAKVEEDLAQAHLISRNVANDKKKVTTPHSAISIFNFHYATPPKTVAMNYALDKPIGDNETGFRGTGDTHYRREGWQFILAGGALYNNLDYSFTVGHEDGTFAYPDSQPGGGGATLRRQLEVLKEFIDSFDFVSMHPDTDFIRDGVPEKVHPYGLSEDGQQYAAYFFGGEKLELTLLLPNGKYQVEWVNPLTGEVAKEARVSSQGKPRTVHSPTYETEIALRILRQQ